MCGAHSAACPLATLNPICPLTAVAGQHTLALQEWAESLSLRGMALRLSDPLDEHMAKQQAGSGTRIAERQLATDRLQGPIAPFATNHLGPFFSEASSSSSSVVDQTLKRIRGFQLGRNKLPSKEGSEGPSRDGLRRESPSLLDKFKSALHIDGGEGSLRGKRGGISGSSPSC